MALDIFKNLNQQAQMAMIKVFGLDRAFNDEKGGGIGGKDDLNKSLSAALGQFNYNPAFASIYTSYVKSEIDRKKQYKEYDSMEDESEVIATALDMYAEDSTDFDSFVGARVWITGADEVSIEANKLLKRLKIEKNMPRIARNVAKYGDFFLGIQTDKDKAKVVEEGIAHVETSYYPRDVMPIVRDYKLLGYWVMDAEKVMKVAEEGLKAPWEFVHFAIPGDANFITYDSPMEYETKRSDLVEYGQSILKASRKPYKRSKLMHDILAIARITRSPLKRVFKFHTDTNNPIAQITALAMFKKTLEKIGGVDKFNDNLSYDELMNIMTQDIYIPLGKDTKGDYSFDTLGGEVEVKAISDIELFDNRLFMSLRIPKEFLNFDEAKGDKQTLLLKDIRYSKRIKKLQNALRNGIKELIFIHFALKGKVLSEDDFVVNMASTSISEDLERLDYYGNAVQTADSLLRMLEGFMVKVEPDVEGNPQEEQKYDRDYLAYYILKYIVKLPSFDMDKFNPKMKSFEDEPKNKGKVEKTKAFVESNQHLVNSMLQKSMGQLREAAEEINSLVVKDYRKEAIKMESFDHASLKAYCEGIITAKDKLLEKQKESKQVIEE